MNEKLEKLNRELAKGEARLRRAQHEEKILEHQLKQLTRKERTHRLCTRGAMPRRSGWHSRRAGAHTALTAMAFGNQGIQARIRPVFQRHS